MQRHRRKNPHLLRRARRTRAPAGKAAQHRPPLAPGARAPPSVGVLEVAFHRASLATPRGSTKTERDRRRAQLKIVRSGATVSRQIQAVVRGFQRPPLTDLEKALIAGRFGPGTFERSMLRLARALERIRGLQREAERGLSQAPDHDALAESVRRFYGRVSSHVREIDPDLERLAEIRAFLKERPKLDPAVPTLAVAGFPNVGKSALVARLSTARPKVADFPFTTLAIEVGHADLGFDRWQILDTPGVLGRESRVNPAEAEASTAVHQGAQVVLFVMDPSERCGYTMAEQEQLLARWRRELPGRPIIEIESKADLTVPGSGRRLRVSSVTGEGIDALREAIRTAMPARASSPAPLPVVDLPLSEEDRAVERLGRRSKPRARPR